MAERREVGCSWIPTTPAKPGSAKEQLICSNTPQSPCQNVSACSSNPVDVMKGGGVVESQVYSEVLSSFDTWQANNVDQWANMSFCDLLAMADANAKRDVGWGAKFTISNVDNLQARSLGGVTNVQNTGWGGISCGEKFVPRTCTSSFEPVTPEKNRKVDQRQDSAAMHGLSTNNGHRIKEALHNMITREEITEHSEMNEQSHLVSATKPTELQENHQLDKEGSDEADLDKTPQQKPRRRKHRPKVIREGKTKNTPAPSPEKHLAPQGTTRVKQAKNTPAPSPEKHLAPQETTRVKRKYVRRKVVQNCINSLSEVGGDETDSNNKGSIANGTPVSNRKCMGGKGVNKPDNMIARSSCRRSLNFDLESQIRDESSVYSSSKCNTESRVESCSGENQRRTTVEYAEGKKVIMGQNDTVISNGMTHFRHQGVDDYVSTAVQVQQDFLPRDQSVSVKGKCKIVFSDGTNDEEASTVQVAANIHVKLTAAATDSTGTSSLLTPEIPSEGLQSQHVDGTAKAQQDSEDATGAAPILQDSNSNENVERRLESSAEPSPVSKNLGYSFPQGSMKTGQQLFEELMALEPKKRARKRNYKSPARVQDLNCKLPMPVKKSKPGSKNGQHTNEGAGKATRRLPNNSLHMKVQNGDNQHEFPTRSSGQPLAITWECISTVDSVVHQLNLLKLNEETNQNRSAFSADHIHYQNQLNLNEEISRNQSAFPADHIHYQNQLNLNEEISQNQSAFPADHIHYQAHCAIVPYQTGGAVVPFDVSLCQIKRKRPRAKVELDDETNRVWKLLLENINSEGVDGTDERNAKWWDEERRVFQGRADSFIARMHLVQGDRRFSPWKGSVVDSVVGVFLTQNVSDHLSSSAYMSLAARFPLEAKSNPAELHETSVSPEINEPEVCVLGSEDTYGSNKKSVLDHVRFDNAKSGNDTEDGDIYSFVDGIPKQGFRDTSDCSPVISHVSDGNKLTSLNGDGFDTDEAVSSQASVISSQNSADSLIHHTTESEEPSSSARPNMFTSSISFVELLQMAGTVLHGVYGNCDDKEEYNERQKENPESSPIDSQQSGLSVESVSQCAMKFTFVSSTESADNDKINPCPDVPENQIGEVPPLGQFQGVICNSDLPDMSTSPQSLIDVTGSNSNVDLSKRSEQDEVRSKNGLVYYPGETVNGPKPKGAKIRKEKNTAEWDGLRKDVLKDGVKKERTINTMDTVDWEAVRIANVGEIADAIKERGMNNKLAERIQDFLNRTVRDHGGIDLEWLRDVAPDKAKEYLLSVRGLGLKSVECVRLLTLHQLAFPVDTNVGRIAVRLGWVPLQPLPESLQLHLLELYPILESIQKYLWPRLCKLDQRTLYELHYQMITFGKVFCTKSKPNCNSCPMRGECRHFASAFASARLALPAPADNSIVAAAENKPGRSPKRARSSGLQLPSAQTYHMAVTSDVSNSQPIIEEPKTPEPIIEMPGTPEQSLECDIEDMLYEDPDDIPTIHLNMEQFTQNLHKVMEQNAELQAGNWSSALVALTAAAASIPVPKLKNVSRLRTEHHVYELPDSHPLLDGMERREPDDPSPYLLAIWTPGETIDSIEPPQKRCSSQETQKLCSDETCSSCNSIREQNSQIVRGTLLIPCRTAMRGSFPLNGTYFQVNEVFSDNESSLTPIDVPRQWLWNLPRRVVYFGTSIPTIFKGLTTEQIQHCFWRGFVCVRGFDRNTRCPRPLIARMHFPASKMAKGNAAEN